VPACEGDTSTGGVLKSKFPARQKIAVLEDRKQKGFNSQQGLFNAILL